MKKCVFAGTFDPFTVGHEDTVKKCLALFDEVVIAVAENKNKSCLFPVEMREKMILAVYKGEPRVRVVTWNGAIVDLLKKENTRFYVRGVRNFRDFDYETADFYASRKLDPDMITLYLPAEQEHLHISSTLVKNSIAFDKPFESYLPKAIYEIITEKKDV
ncbi:MAG: pantetheine-phosphate adenylyltransferase [Clostridia bacterium]|nr:pantetheine-phosphate adenylyltransferase [Clostridia bacterium]